MPSSPDGAHEPIGSSEGSLAAGTSKAVEITRLVRAVVADCFHPEAEGSYKHTS